VLECWTTLTAIAATVPRIAIGPLVVNVANRDPGMLAVMAATLQEVSGGRLLLGVGAGGGAGTPYAREQEAFGRQVGGDRARRHDVEVALATLRGVWSGRAGGAAGFLRPQPPPPVVVGAFGPKMAELAGRVGDGLNTQAGHPRLGDLVAVAREARSKAGGVPAGFAVTVFAGLAERWLRRESRERERLSAVGVDRLILLVAPPYVDDIQRAGRLLEAPG
jgi:alkanesulfonate monooxygenase SsuD/methylene tetrahydromethanopterin reductase-like flavin-dependent oxidoreductase (luciferase family)